MEVQKFLDSLNKQYGIKLNEQQSQAVMHKDGPAVILAVPGAGKTTTLLCRTANLVLNYGVAPESILSITFSKMAAIEMKNRFNSTFGRSINGKVNFSTIHSFSYFIIREYSRIKNKSFVIIEEDGAAVNKARLLKNIYFEVNNDYVGNDKYDELCNAIGFVKNMMIKPGEFDRYKFEIPNFKDIFTKYEEIKRKNHYIDFDDMLTFAYEILSKNHEILKRYQERYRYIQVDEGQDTSKIQHEIVKLLVSKSRNLFIVADDDQSIYSFRGAYPDMLLNFKDVYKDAKIFFMEENFRSTNSIVSSSNKLISNNKKRYEKDMVTNNDNGNPVDIIKFNSYTEQIEYLINEIKKTNELRNIAILFRNNISAIPLADILERQSIPFYMRDSKIYFFNHWVTLDLICFMNIAIDGGDIESFEKIYYKMNAYLNKGIIDYIKTSPVKRDIMDLIANYPEIGYHQIKKIQEIREGFKILKSLQPYDAIGYIKYALGYGEYLAKNADRLGYSIGNINLIIERLKMVARGTKTIPEFISRLNTLETAIKNASYNKGSEALTLTTIHSSKGLEYENVYIMDIVDGIFPDSESINMDDNGTSKYLEEERRLFYVGMTRARRDLKLLTIDDKGKIKPSRFIGEMSSILTPSVNEENEFKNINIDLSPGMDIEHKRFGCGKVKRIVGNLLEVDFQGYGLKNLSYDVCVYNNLIKVRGK